MLDFLRKLFGIKTEERIQAPYKVEAPSVTTPVNPQITDAVTQSQVAEPKVNVEKPNARRGPKKNSGGQKPTAPKQSGSRSRKPKSRTQ